LSAEPSRRIKICDQSFAHSNAIGSGDYPWYPRYFKWDRDGSERFTGPVVFTDCELGCAASSPSCFKIALLLESRAIAPKVYQQVLEIEKEFNLILTHDVKLLKRGGKYQFYPFGGCWIAPEECRIYAKQRDVSIIASAKRQTVGHKLRHKVISAMGARLEVFGRGYQPVESKLEGLARYRYSMVIENIREPNYFTEKLVDCFATGTVPIYWGCPNIGEFFDEKGIIPFRNMRELRSLVDKAGPNDYESRLGAIQANLSRVSEFRTPEDWIWKKPFLQAAGVLIALTQAPVLPHERILPGELMSSAQQIASRFRLLRCLRYEIVKLNLKVSN